MKDSVKIEKFIIIYLLFVINIDLYTTGHVHLWFFTHQIKKSHDLPVYKGETLVK